MFRQKRLHESEETSRKDGRAYVQGCKEKIIIGDIMYLYDPRDGTDCAKGKGGCECIR